MSKYVRQRGCKTHQNGEIVMTYHCYRSGTYKPKGKGLKNLKSHGSAKIGISCPAVMKVRQSTQNVVVHYFLKHQNHETQLEHLRLSESDKTAVAGRLKEGVSENFFLQDIREEITVDSGRKMRIEKKDIHSIKRDFNINGYVKRHEIDIGYIALFVCLATKAVHIEAVGDLTTDSFIAALRRFSARRGAPRHIYSDNGTNFVGARRKLDEIRKLWLSLPANEAISYYLSKSSIDWHFIPPSSPHFRGIWESGIRSVKFHLKRVLGETILTFEELTILLTQIEGLLNSRPLSYVNDSDIECISTLTPSHFLTGDVLLSVPQELPSTSNHRDCWELLQNIKRGFWKKWSSEFISSLQPRKQCQDAKPNFKEYDIVLIKEEGPPDTWPMARVLQVHPGNDGLVRVATVKTQNSVLKRPVHKLHKLPIYPN
ncbi:integrase catalytic domain-containing protein [Trichonephila clavipes]|nr:integrase catalytic domain-containing protein [Trichonephila clavipes]